MGTLPSAPLVSVLEGFQHCCVLLCVPRPIETYVGGSIVCVVYSRVCVQVFKSWGTQVFMLH